MEDGMKSTLRYIQETLGIQPTANPLVKSYLDRLPMYINETYKLYLGGGRKPTFITPVRGMDI